MSSKLTEGLTQEEITQLKTINRRSLNYAVIYTYSKLCGNGVAYGLWPFLNWLYPNPEDKEKKIEALKRHTTFFNLTPQFTPFCFGLFASMEKEAKENPDFDVSTIEAVKASIQGPLSGIGDSIFWVTWRVIVTGLALQFSLQGSLVGPILFLLLYNIPAFIIRNSLCYVGYKMGTSVIQRAYESGMIQVLTRVASIVGLIMVGGMAASQISVPITLEFSLNGATQSIYEVFNSILPGMLELMLVLVLLRLIKKKVNVTVMIAAVFVIAIVGAFVGVF